MNSFQNLVGSKKNHVVPLRVKLGKKHWKQIALGVGAGGGSLRYHCQNLNLKSEIEELINSSPDLKATLHDENRANKSLNAAMERSDNS